MFFFNSLSLNQRKAHLVHQFGVLCCFFSLCWLFRLITCLHAWSASADLKQAGASWYLCATFQKDEARNGGVSSRRTLQRSLWIKQFAKILKAMVELRFVKVETAMERKKRWIMEDFPTNLRIMHQFRNFSRFSATRSEPLTLHLPRLWMNSPQPFIFHSFIFHPPQTTAFSTFAFFSEACHLSALQ